MARENGLCPLTVGSVYNLTANIVGYRLTVSWMPAPGLVEEYRIEHYIINSVERHKTVAYVPSSQHTHHSSVLSSGDREVTVTAWAPGLPGESATTTAISIRKLMPVKCDSTFPQL